MGMDFRLTEEQIQIRDIARKFAVQEITPLAAEIDKQLDRGTTFLHGEGSFTGQDRLVLMCAFKQRQIVPLKALVHELDPEAFLIVCDAHEVLGQGFRRYQKNDI